MLSATTPTLSFVESELDEHKTELTEWINKVGELTIPESCKGVCDRFLRDCNTLIGDLSGDAELSSADLCDFVDRKNSLEIQYHNLTEEYQDTAE